jgi:hypothetical protein
MKKISFEQFWEDGVEIVKAAAYDKEFVEVVFDDDISS